MEVAHPLDHRRQQVELGADVARRHVLTRVPVGEVAVEAQVGMALHELQRAPHVLRHRGPVGLEVEGDARGHARLDDLGSQPVGLGVALEAGAHHERGAGDALVDPGAGPLGQPAGLDADVEGHGHQTELAAQLGVGALHALVPRGDRRLEDGALVADGAGAPVGQQPGVAHVEVPAEGRARVGRRGHAGSITTGSVAWRRMKMLGRRVGGESGSRVIERVAASSR